MVIYLKLFLTFLKIGAFTFGGGYAMLPLIQEAVLDNGWMSNEEIVNFIAVSESTPGPFAINSATYVGMQMGGLFGAFCATLGVVLPSFVIILIVAKIFDKFKNNKTVAGCMTGLKPVVIGMIAAALLSLAKTVFIPNGFSTGIFSEPSFYISLGIFAVMTVLAMKKAHPILIICISAVVGIASGFILGL
ncbi:MAG: chromate transporter [Clostridia bacterium]|nr:chromate transporter [Clostridia bacterium]